MKKLPGFRLFFFEYTTSLIGLTLAYRISTIPIVPEFQHICSNVCYIFLFCTTVQQALLLPQFG